MTRQELRHHARRLGRSARSLEADERNLVPIAHGCHGAHHAGGNGRLELWRLPDPVFEFAAEVLGPGPAWVYLRRHYRGQDPRLDALAAG